MNRAPRYIQRSSSPDLQHDVKPSWLELEYVDERSDAGKSWIVVTLNCNGRLSSGASPSIEQKHCRHGIHRAALAALNAVELFSDHLLSCELTDVASVAKKAQSMVLVRVRISSAGESVDLFGSAPVAGDFAEAAVLAVLDAANVYVHNLAAQV